MMSLTLIVILTSLGFFLDSLLERLLGKIEEDFFNGKILTALIMAWRAEIAVDAAFDWHLSNLVFVLLVKTCALGLQGCLGSDLNPVEAHEFDVSLRKSLSILGLPIPSFGSGFLCCSTTLVFEYEAMV